MAETLVGLGIDSISTELDALNEIRAVVARAERRLLIEKVLESAEAQEEEREERMEPDGQGLEFLAYF